jgi:hypothetical protein
MKIVEPKKTRMSTMKIMKHKPKEISESHKKELIRFNESNKLLDEMTKILETMTQDKIITNAIKYLKPYKIGLKKSRENLFIDN